MNRLEQIFLSSFQLLRPSLWLYVAAVPALWTLVSLSGPESPEQQWTWLEAVWIPVGVLYSTDGFVGRYERGELEPYLARHSARRLFLMLTLPSLGCLVFSSLLITLNISGGTPLVVIARSTLLFGAVQAVLMLTRSRWFTVTFFSLWWLLGLVYMTDWASDPRTFVLMWHPMRVSGGGELVLSLEWGVLALGLSLLLLAWLFVGRDSRWV